MPWKRFNYVTHRILCFSKVSPSIYPTYTQSAPSIYPAYNQSDAPQHIKYIPLLCFFIFLASVFVLKMTNMIDWYSSRTCNMTRLSTFRIRSRTRIKRTWWATTSKWLSQVCLKWSFFFFKSTVLKSVPHLQSWMFFIEDPLHLSRGPYNFQLLPLFIGPESDHGQCLSVTHWLTHWLPFRKLHWCDPGLCQNLLRLLQLLILVMKIVLATVCCRFWSWGLVIKLNFCSNF